MVPETGLEPVWLKPLDFESSASANSATSATVVLLTSCVKQQSYIST